MQKIWNKGHRIRASDKHLVYHFSIGTLLFVFVAVLLLLNIKQLMRTDWEHFSLLENGLTLSPYNFITILIATGVCALVAFLYYRFCYDSFKKLLHRQKLARMILFLFRCVIMTLLDECVLLLSQMKGVLIVISDTQNAQSPTKEKKTYTVEEIAEQLDISKKVAYSLVKSGQFNYVRAGKAIRVSKISFDKWLNGI